MGATTSREFSDAVATYVDRGGNLENLLEDPKVFVRRWKPSCQALPPEAQKLLKDLTRQTYQAKREKTYLSKLEQVQESEICIPESLEPTYTSWIQPTTFFNPSERLKGASPAAQLYEELRHIAQRKVDDPIRTRIYAVALYDVRLQIDENNCLQLKRGIKEKIVQVISESSVVHDSLEDVEKWTKLYLKFGERMKEIAVENGGLGALIMMPLLRLSLYQWTRGLSTDELKNYILHLQSLNLAEKARNANAHEVAHRIHILALQGFTSGIEELNAHHEEAEEDSISEDVVEDDRLSNTSNATSSCTSLSTLAQDCRRSQEPIYPPGIEDDELMATDERRRAHRSTLEFNGERSNGMSGFSRMDLLSQAANVASHQNGQRNEGYNPVATVQPFQNTPSGSFSTTAMRRGHDFATEVNRIPTSQSAHSQPLESFQTPQPFQNPYLQPLESPQPFQNPYRQPFENLQIPQRFQNPYLQPFDSFEIPQPFQNPYPLDNLQAVQQFQNVHQSQSEEHHALPTPQDAPIVSYIN